MNKIFICLIGGVILLSIRVSAQQALSPQNTLQTLNGADNKKTLDRQNQLANFVQVVGNNLTNNNKGVQLQGSIFAFNVFQDSATKYNFINYKRYNWQRYLQMTIGGGIDSNNQFNTFTSGIDFDFLNHRDSSMVEAYSGYVSNLVKGYHDSLFSKVDQVKDKYGFAKTALFKKDLKNLISNLSEKGDSLQLKDLQTLTWYKAFRPEAMKTLIHEVDSIMDSWKKLGPIVLKTSQEGFYNDSTSPFTLLAQSFANSYTESLNEKLKTYLDTVFYDQKLSGKNKRDTSADFQQWLTDINAMIAADSMFFHASSIENVYLYLGHVADSCQRQIAQRPLLVGAFNYGYANKGTRHTLIPSLEYMRGLSRNVGRTTELDIYVADSVYSDTSAYKEILLRNVGTVKPSLNCNLAVDKSGQSLLEAKIGPEYDHVFGSLYTKETRDKYFFNLTLLGRPSSKSPWFTLTVKYDTHQHNFLGFLNASFALDNASNSK